MCRPTYGDMHDFRPICSPRERVPCSAPEVTPMPQSRLIGTIGLVTWMMVALPALLYHVPALLHHGPFIDWRWIAVFLGFGVLFALDLRRPHLLLLALAAVMALALVLLRCNGYEGALLALIAMQLGTRVGPGTGIAWIFGQSALLAAGDAITFNPQSARLLVPPYLALQLVAFFVFRAMRRETAAREALAASNAELRGVAPILADSSRMAERLRITRELHDALGHHLTALWLRVRCEAGTLRIEARDDGRGSQGADGGFGIRGMRERVAQAGGELRVVTQPGHGFEVTALLPVRGGAA